MAPNINAEQLNLQRVWPVIENAGLRRAYHRRAIHREKEIIEECGKRNNWVQYLVIPLKTAILGGTVANGSSFASLVKGFDIPFVGPVTESFIITLLPTLMSLLIDSMQKQYVQLPLSNAKDAKALHTEAALKWSHALDLAEDLRDVLVEHRESSEIPDQIIQSCSKLDDTSESLNGEAMSGTIPDVTEEELDNLKASSTGNNFYSRQQTQYSVTGWKTMEDIFSRVFH
eukprot:m.98905 g.98905  ORF g.98905 m.98905 type:complete len:229 (-) comp16764_c0_seq1:695-1381(-)